jgi:KRAB domain-containing zinc finger protein
MIFLHDSDLRVDSIQIVIFILQNLYSFILIQDHTRIHINRDAFMCPHCGKTFSVKSNLKKHLELHTAVRAFGCSQCEKSFVDQRRLDSHMRIHAGVKPFPCPHCEKGYVDANSLKGQ